MKFTPEQDSALLKVDSWFKNDAHTKPFFYVAGYAGVGKTTLAKHFAEGIGGSVKFATFTGKAAHVMAQKGCAGATTVHRLIYRPKMAGKEKLRSLEKELETLKAEPEPYWEVIQELEEAIRVEQENASRMSFALNTDSELKFAKLLIVDEISMVGTQMAEDLLSFGVPILVLGDPEQLPPIYGAGYFTEQEPDILLQEIHRQALDNPIISMSKQIREGNDLPLGCYGNSRVVNEKLDGEDIMAHDIILTGLRKTKKACDDKCRSLLNKSGPLPLAGDRVMCIKNNHNLGLLNGQSYVAQHDAVSTGTGIISLYLQNIDDGEEKVVTAAEKPFLGQPLQRWEHEEDVEEFEYAYAITVHKSQGSQWDNVLLFDQKHCFPNWSERDRRRWLYTGITRAAKRVTVMRL